MSIGNQSVRKWRRASLAAVLLASSLASAAQPRPAPSDEEAVRTVLAQYKSAIERLDASATEALFTRNSRIFENGSDEGSYSNYLAHHLGPELGHFRSFRFSDYRVQVTMAGNVAYAAETYRYRIEPREGEAIERQGAATSVLTREGTGWRIALMHNSSRRPRGS
jgi:ketosteroid isomerase-like protein